ncbi:MAG: hypothetical protein NTZ34_04345 [Chloroflexi bacterium]|nr:hypothetical protein [Chloroflexota bacterium]
MKPGLFFLLATVIAVSMLAGCVASCNDPLHGNFKVYPGTVEEGQPPSNTYTAPAVAPSDTTERHITITESNSVFSIGVPKGYREERQVTAEKPIDYWFEYIGENVTLTVNGNDLEVPVRRTTTKLGYTSSVTSFSYTIYNYSSAATSYNLRMTPSKAGDSVPAVTREKWIAP